MDRFWMLVVALVSVLVGRSQAAYLLSDSTQSGGHDYEFIDIRLSGEEVIGENVETGGTLAQLEMPLVFYNEVVYRVVISANGYISTLESDEGLDSTPDRLPASPSLGGGARIYPYHADIEIGSIGSSAAGFPRGVFYQYFHRSPHSYSTGGVHIFQWERVNHRVGAPGLPTFQALVFDDGDVIFQYKDIPAAVSTREFTVGVQRSVPVGYFGAVLHAKYHDRDTDPDVSGGLALLFEPPSIEVDTVTQPSPIGFTNLHDAVEVVGTQEVIHKIKFSPALSGAITDLASNL